MKSKSFRVFVFIFVILIATFTLSGCTKRVGWYGSSGNGHMKASFKTFSGNEVKSFDVKEGQTLDFGCNSKVYRGNLVITIKDSKDNNLIEIQKNKKVYEKLEVKKGDRYSVVVTGESAKGTYDITWKVK